MQRDQHAQAIGPCEPLAALGHDGHMATEQRCGRRGAEGNHRFGLDTLHPAALLRTPPDFQAAAYTAWLNDLRQADSLVQATAS